MQALTKISNGKRNVKVPIPTSYAVRLGSDHEVSQSGEFSSLAPPDDVRTLFLIV